MSGELLYVMHGRSRTNLSREGKCIKFQFSVYLIYQNMYQLAAISAPFHARLNHKAILKPLRYHYHKSSSQSMSTT